MPPRTRRLSKLRGVLSREIVRKGTGSEHLGYILTTSKGERYSVIRLGENPFENEGLEEFVGVEIEVTGYVVGKEIRGKSLRLKRER